MSIQAALAIQLPTSMLLFIIVMPAALSQSVFLVPGCVGGSSPSMVSECTSSHRKTRISKHRRLARERRKARGQGHKHMACASSLVWNELTERNCMAANQIKVGKNMREWLKNALTLRSGVNTGGLVIQVQGLDNTVAE